MAIERVIKLSSGEKLRVFEAFAGIGAQASALERMNINYEIVGISDWFIDAIECYAAIHCSGVEVDMPEDISVIDEYLSKFTFSATSVEKTNIKVKRHRSNLAILFASNSKFSTLRKRCRLKAKTKTAQFLLTVFLSRTIRARQHGVVQLFCAHSASIIKNTKVWGVCKRVRIYINFGSFCGHAVVKNVGNCGGETISNCS